MRLSIIDVSLVCLLRNPIHVGCVGDPGDKSWRWIVGFVDSKVCSCGANANAPATNMVPEAKFNHGCGKALTSQRKKQVRHFGVDHELSSTKEIHRFNRWKHVMVCEYWRGYSNYTVTKHPGSSWAGYSGCMWCV